MYAEAAPWIVTILFALIALWSAWAVTAAIQGHRRRRAYPMTRSRSPRPVASETASS